MYDYLIVGAGMFGCVLARELTDCGKRVLVIDKKNHIGGNCYTENIEGINVHKYGAHIFHTSSKEVWEYVCRFADFNHYVNAPIAVCGDELYNLPFNMNTFSKMWGIKTPKEALSIIERQRRESGVTNPKNLEEQALLLVGRDIYEKLIKGYTEKQWGRPCADLPADIIKRLPLRFTYDNNYFNDRFQGIPIGGYTAFFERLLDGIKVELDCDFVPNRVELEKRADKIIYSGMIDEYYDFAFGQLEYRSLHFETEIHNVPNYQGNAVVNFASASVPYTRIIEHKHFEFGTQEKTVVTKEYPLKWSKGQEPFYPITNQKNIDLFNKYAALSKQNSKIIFGGRLGRYAYLDMDKTIFKALELFKELA